MGEEGEREAVWGGGGNGGYNIACSLPPPPPPFLSQSIAYLLSGNMDKGSQEFQLEAAISKVFSSVSLCSRLDLFWSMAKGPV